MKKGPKPKPIEERFWKHVNKNGPIHPILNTPCWLWTGTTSSGYGSFWNGIRFVGAHRFSFILHKGPIDKPFVCHKCDNRLCCNPEHLFSGTNKDNMVDCVSKGRHRKNYDIDGESNPAAKLSESQVLEIRRLASLKIPRKVLAEQFRVSLPLIEKIISRSVWKHI